MKQGTIVLTPFPFTDLSTSKRRPAIVISKNNEQTDIIVAYISSKISEHISVTDYLLKSSHKDFPVTGLLKDSIIKLNKIVTVDKSLFTGEIGFVSKEILDEILLRLKIVFGI